MINYSIIILTFSFTISSIAQDSLSGGFQTHTLDHYSDLAHQMIRSSLTEKRGYEWLKELCDIGPRLSGSEKSLKAIYWAKNKLELIGCDSVWLQPVMVPKWVRGNVETAQISKSKNYENRKLSIASFGGSIGTPEDGIIAEILEVKSLDEVQSLGNNAKGKIIFYNRAFDNGIVNTFEAYGKAVDQRIRGAIEAAKVGAVASLVRSVTSKYDNIPHTGVMAYQDSVKAIPSAAIGLVDADFLSKAIKEEPYLKITIKMDCQNYPEIESYNVIGEIKGKEKPDEVIVIGGHFDSWDKGCGAHDDGAPCIQTMEVLDLMKRLSIHPKRTIRCILFINEENGLRGGTVYGQYADSCKETHYAAMETDRGAFTPRGFSVMADSSIIKKIQVWLPILNKAHIDWIRQGGSGGDVAQIKNAKAWFGFVPDDQRYMDVHHSDNDTFDSVHPREMQLGTAAMTIMIYLLSEEGL